MPRQEMHFRHSFGGEDRLLEARRQFEARMEHILATWTEIEVCKDLLRKLEWVETCESDPKLAGEVAHALLARLTIADGCLPRLDSTRPQGAAAVRAVTATIRALAAEINQHRDLRHQDVRDGLEVAQLEAVLVLERS